jgi:uncharacterized membrane protein
MFCTTRSRAATNFIITPLGHIGTDSNNFTTAQAYQINDSGTDLGSRPVRWNIGTTTPTELGVLSTHTSGYTQASANALNDSGVVVGYGQLYSGTTDQGARAVRWNAGSTAPTQLGTLGANSSGFASSSAFAINGAQCLMNREKVFEAYFNWRAAGIHFLTNFCARLPTISPA